MDNLIAQLEGKSSKDLPMHELLGLDKQLRSIRGSLKVEVAKKVQLEQCIKQEEHKLEETATIQNTTLGFKKISGSKVLSWMIT